MGSFPCWTWKASSEEEVEDTRNRRKQLDQSSWGGRGIWWDSEFRGNWPRRERDAYSTEAGVAKIKSGFSYNSHLITSTSLSQSKHAILLGALEPWDRATEFPEKSKMSVVENSQRTKFSIHKRLCRCHWAPDRGWNHELTVASSHVVAWFPPSWLGALSAGARKQSGADLACAMSKERDLRYQQENGHPGWTGGSEEQENREGLLVGGR